MEKRYKFLKSVLVWVLIFHEPFALQADASGVHDSTHEYKEVWRQEPDCVTEGYREYHCLTCGLFRVTIPALGHDEQVNEVPPDCTNEGTLTYTCIRCNANRKEIVEKLDHDYTCSISLEPTDTEPGKYLFRCESCSAGYEEEIPPLGHAFQVEEILPTCQKEGSLIYTCSRCGIQYTEVQKKLEHQYVYQVIQEPGEERPGKYQYRCSSCKEGHEGDIPALGHQPEVKEIITKGHSYEEQVLQEEGQEAEEKHTYAPKDIYKARIPTLGHEPEITGPTAPAVKTKSQEISQKSYENTGMREYIMEVIICIGALTGTGFSLSALSDFQLIQWYRAKEKENRRKKV